MATSRLCAGASSPPQAAPSAHLARGSLHQLLERQVVDLVLMLTENLRAVFREQGIQSAAFNVGAQVPGLQGGHTLGKGGEEPRRPEQGRRAAAFEDGISWICLPCWASIMSWSLLRDHFVTSPFLKVGSGFYCPEPQYESCHTIGVHSLPLWPKGPEETDK